MYKSDSDTRSKLRHTNVFINVFDCIALVFLSQVRDYYADHFVSS